MMVMRIFKEVIRQYALSQYLILREHSKMSLTAQKRTKSGFQALEDHEFSMGVG